MGKTVRRDARILAQEHLLFETITDRAMVKKQMENLGFSAVFGEFIV
jgi:hypothetical protein